MVTIAEHLPQIERDLSKKTLKVGFMSGAMYDTDYPNFGGKNNRRTRKAVLVAQVPFWAEYGTNYGLAPIEGTLMFAEAQQSINKRGVKLLKKKLKSKGYKVK
jgi:hypothetical protein